MSRNLTDHWGALLLFGFLFLMAGVAASLNDILNPFLKRLFALSYREAALVHFCYYVSPVLLSVPAGYLTERIGYRGGAALAVSIMAAGCLLMGPASGGSTFGVFLLAVLIISSGSTLLGVGVNPYVAGLGQPATASGRLNLTHGCYAVGTTLGPLLGSFFVKADSELAATAIRSPYFIVGGIFALIALLLARYPLPAPRAEETAEVQPRLSGTWWRHRPLLLGFVAIFFYVGAEVSVGSLIVKYLEQPAVAGFSPGRAGFFVSVYWAGLMLGRFAGIWIMQRRGTAAVLRVHALLGAAAVVPVIVGQGWPAMWGLLSLGLWNSIMFPAIFALALRGLGSHTRRASGFLLMAVVGGAILPVVQGSLADLAGLPVSFGLVFLCYTVVLFYATWGYRLPHTQAATA